MDNSSSQALIFMFVRVGRKTYGTLKFVWAVDTWKFISPSNNHILELVNKRITKNNHGNYNIMDERDSCYNSNRTEYCMISQSKRLCHMSN